MSSRIFALYQRIWQQRLNDIARDYVGDDRCPLWFVSDGPHVVMATSDEQSARDYWRRLAMRQPLRESALENKTGVVSSVCPESNEPNSPLRIEW